MKIASMLLSVPLVCWLLTGPTSVVAAAEYDECTFSQPVSLWNGQLKLSHWISDDDDPKVAFRVEYQERAWVGVGFGKKMAGSQAVVGVPTARNEDDKVRLYNLVSYGEVTPVDKDDDDYDIIVAKSTSLKQTNSATTLEFIRSIPTDKDGNLLVSPGQKADLILAVGVSNALGYHKMRGVEEITFSHVCEKP